MGDDPGDLLDLTAAERTLRKLAQDAREQIEAGQRPDDLFECYRLVIDELDRVRARLHDLEGEGPHVDGRQAMRAEPYAAPIQAPLPSKIGVCQGRGRTTTDCPGVFGYCSGCPVHPDRA